MIEAPDWRGSVEGILGGIEQELEGPNPDAAMLEDLKVMLDDTRNVIQAYGSAGDTIDYLKALQEIRLRRAIGVCKNVMNDLQAGRVPNETLGLAALREVLEKLIAHLRVEEGR